MGVKELRKLGSTAEQLADGVEDINTINNTLGPRYDALLDRARTLTSNPTLMLVDLTDAQINNGLLEGRGLQEDIDEAKVIIGSWERVTVAVRAEVAGLPDVNE